MSKQEFLDQLRVMAGDSIVLYYDELISDRIENGESEESVVASYDLKKIARALDFESTKKELEQESKKKNKSKGLVVIIALCAFPVTLPLGIALCAIIFSLIVTAVSLLASGILGVLWVILGTVSMIISSEPIGLILLSSGGALVALGIVGLIGYYGFMAIKRFYDWLMIKFFKKAKDRKLKGQKGE